MLFGDKFVLCLSEIIIDYFTGIFREFYFTEGSQKMELFKILPIFGLDKQKKCALL